MKFLNPYLSYFLPVYTFPFITFNALCLQIPSTARSASRASNEDSEDDSIRTSVSACDAQPESSTSAAGRKSSALPKKKARRVDDALLDYLSRPRPSDNIAEQVRGLSLFFFILTSMSVYKHKSGQTCTTCRQSRRGKGRPLL